jgi:hypothetical protein
MLNSMSRLMNGNLFVTPSMQMVRSIDSKRWLGLRPTPADAMAFVALVRLLSFVDC